MKTKMIALLALVAAPLLAATPEFAPIGINNNRTARINAYFGAEPHLVPPGPCDGVIQLRFYDSTGGVLAEKTSRFSPTAVESLEFTPARDTAARTQIRAQISWVEVPPGPCRGNVIANVEVYNNDTGETQFVLPGTAQQ